MLIEFLVKNLNLKKNKLKNRKDLLQLQDLKSLKNNLNLLKKFKRSKKNYLLLRKSQAVLKDQQRMKNTVER